MNAFQLKQYVVHPTLELMGGRFHSIDAERLLVAIAVQESALRYRLQINGPARGLWQFERAGGVNGVLTHPASASMAKWLCEELLYKPDPVTVYEVIRDNDILACGFARLLLWTDPKSLPTTESEAWYYYLRNWRPGRPHPETWAVSWSAAA